MNITILSAGEFDLRVVVDPDETISERDEGNNEVFLLIGAADPEVVGSVSGFAPDLVLLLLAGLFAGRVVNRRQSAS
ncbi:MAG: CARDB domain-containing protein [Candidatus Thalassarchaeaceae archaeon]|nr:CARDB domain-containing protein [Candidatus Thalassarchaeaceae archaeon]